MDCLTELGDPWLNDEDPQARGWMLGGVKPLQYERWTIWGWVVRVLLTLLLIGTAIQLIGVLVGLVVE